MLPSGMDQLRPLAVNKEKVVSSDFLPTSPARFKEGEGSGSMLHRLTKLSLQAPVSWQGCMLVAMLDNTSCFRLDHG